MSSSSNVYKYSYNVKPFVHCFYHHADTSFGMIMWTVAFEYGETFLGSSRLELNLGWVVV